MATHEERPLWHFYHEYDGKIRLDRAESTAHLDQHYKGDPKYTRAFVAGAPGPLTDDELRAHLDYHELPMDTGHKASLKSFERQAPHRLSKNK